MIKCIVNGIEMDLSDSDFAVSYEASSDFKFHSNTSVDIEFPKTANNLRAVENNDVVLNNSALPYNFIPSSIEVNGIDMKIEYAVLKSISNAIKLQFFGGNITSFADVKDKSIQDLDFSSLDHTRNWAYISGHQLETTNILYPLIDYGALSSLNNYIDIEYLYPAIFVHTVINRMLTEIGYTLTGDLATDAEYLKLIIPFCNKNSYVDPALITSLLFEATLADNVASTVTGAISLITLSYLNEVSDPASRFDGIYYYPAVTGAYTFHLIHRVQVPTTPTQVGLAIHRIRAGVDTVLQVFSFADYTNLFTTTWELSEDTNAFDLKNGDKIYVDLAVDENVTSNVETSIELLSITNTSVGYGENWQVAPNLPNIKQGELLKYVLNTFGCIIQCDDATKKMAITKISTIIDNCYNGFSDDWSDLLDRGEDELTFTQNAAQVNHLTYKDEDNFIKPLGTDYDLLIGNKSLPPEKDLYSAPFGASEATIVFPFEQTVWRVDINGASNLAPRILVSNPITIASHVFKYLGSTQATHTNTNIPYFISNSTFNLGFDYLRQTKMKDVLDLMLQPKQLKVKIRLTEKHINQLDFSKPVWLDYYKCWFYKSKISQFKYDKKESTICELIKLI